MAHPLILEARPQSIPANRGNTLDTTTTLFGAVVEGLDNDLPGVAVLRGHLVDLSGATNRVGDLEDAAGTVDTELQHRRSHLTTEVAAGTVTATDAARELADLERDHDVLTVGADDLNRDAIRHIRRSAMRALHADREAITAALDALVSYLSTVLTDAADTLTRCGVATPEQAALAEGEGHAAWADALGSCERMNLVWRLAAKLRDLHVCDEVRNCTTAMYEWHAWPEHRKPPTRHTPPLQLAAAIIDGAVPGVLSATEVVTTWIEPAPKVQT